MKFNWNKILNANTVIHCDTEAKANALLTEADSRGLKWCYSGTYNDNNRYDIHYDNTCYDFNNGYFGSRGYCEKHNYKILTYEDVLDYKSLCGKLKIGDKIKHKGWNNITTIDLIGDNMCLESREKNLCILRNCYTRRKC